MHWAWKTKVLINLFCLNFSSPWSTFQTQAFLGKECTLSQGARKEQPPNTENTPSQIPTPFLKSRICNANLSTFLHPGKKLIVIHHRCEETARFPSTFLTLSWSMNLCQTKPNQNKTKHFCLVFIMAAHLGQYSQGFSLQNNLTYYFSILYFVHDAEINH